jgi:hypothetical protein
MNCTDFSPGMRVLYVPHHAQGNINHPDAERGTVSSTTDKYVFVKFDKHLNRHGWDGTTSQACDPGDLRQL